MMCVGRKWKVVVVVEVEVEVAAVVVVLVLVLVLVLADARVLLSTSVRRKISFYAALEDMDSWRRGPQFYLELPKECVSTCRAGGWALLR